MRRHLPAVKASTLHAHATVAWTGLAIPTVLWWKTSIAWVAFMSLYANWVGHLTGISSSKAKEAVELEQDEQHGDDDEPDHGPADEPVDALL